MRKEASDGTARTVEKVFLENLLLQFNGNIAKTSEHIAINKTNRYKMTKKCEISNHTLKNPA